MRIPHWLTKHWEQCVQAIRSGKMPHALLLAGPPGLGKLDFAQQLSQLLLCEENGDAACGHCSSCHWYEQGTHPDFVLVTPEEDKKQIGIASIRDLTLALGKTAHGKSQVVIVHPAEAMNRAAANALLKTLEEPSGLVVLILVSNHPAGLLATIRSRCQTITCQPPTREAALQWLNEELQAINNKNMPDPKRLLALSDGLPFQALRLAQSGEWDSQELICTQFLAALCGKSPVSQIAVEWSKLSVTQVLAIIATVVQDMVCLTAGATTQQLYYGHRINELQKMINAQPSGQLWSLWQDIIQARRRALSTANPNIPLLFEGLLLPYVQVR